MVAPTVKMRALVFKRDHHRCAACGVLEPLEFQHRQATGMGGSKILPEPWEGLVLCKLCNQLVEGPMQSVGLAKGWKVRRWVKHAGLVPVWFSWAREWRVLDGDLALPITPEEAAHMMRQVYGDEFDEWEAA